MVENAIANGHKAGEILKIAKINGRVSFLIKFMDLNHHSEEVYLHKIYERHHNFRQEFDRVFFICNLHFP